MGPGLVHWSISETCCQGGAMESILKRTGAAQKDIEGSLLLQLVVLCTKNLRLSALVCLALGLPELSSAARYQLALVHSVVHDLQIGPKRVFFYDPVLTEADRHAIESYGYRIATLESAMATIAKEQEESSREENSENDKGMPEEPATKTRDDEIDPREEHMEPSLPTALPTELTSEQAHRSTSPTTPETNPHREVLFFLPHASLELTDHLISTYKVSHLLANDVVAHTDRLTKKKLYDSFRALSYLKLLLDAPAVDTGFQTVKKKRRNRQVFQEPDLQHDPMYFTAATVKRLPSGGPWDNAFTDLAFHSLS